MFTPTRIGFVEGQNVSNEYATVSSWSLDNRHLLLFQSGGWVRLHDGNGAYIRTLPSDVNHSSRPRWSGTNPDVLTYIQGNILWAYNVVDGTATTARLFKEYIEFTEDGRNGIDDSGEADQVGVHRVLSGKKADGTVEVFGYNLATNEKGTPLPPLGNFDGLKLSHDLRIIRSQPEGIFVTDGLAWRRIYPHNSHCVPCVYQQTQSLAVVGDKNIILVDLSTAKQTAVPFVVDSTFVVAHVSACDKPFLILSTSAPANNAPSQIVRISLEDLSAEVMRGFTTIYRDYSSQPKATLSRDGSRCVYAVDDGTQISTWMLRLDASEPSKPFEAPSKPTETRINYAPYAGKSEFVLVPRADGAVDIFERKLR